MVLNGQVHVKLFFILLMQLSSKALPHSANLGPVLEASSSGQSSLGLKHFQPLRLTAK